MYSFSSFFFFLGVGGKVYNGRGWTWPNWKVSDIRVHCVKFPNNDTVLEKKKEFAFLFKCPEAANDYIGSSIMDSHLSEIYGPK